MYKTRCRIRPDNGGSNIGQMGGVGIMVRSILVAVNTWPSMQLFWCGVGIIDALAARV